MEASKQQPTAVEHEYFDHARRAEERGETLTAYCQREGLNVRTLYGARRRLMQKGLLPRLRDRKAKPKRKQFVAVQVAAPVAGGGEGICRLRHPSGWVLECGRWPEASWLAELMKGGGDASA